MTTSSVVPVGQGTIPATALVPKKSSKPTKVSELVRNFFHSLHFHISHNQATKVLGKSPYPARKLVPVCLDLAATAFIPFDESLSKKIPCLNICLAAIQGVISLRSIGSKITKSVRAIKEKRQYVEQLKETKKELRLVSTPSARARREIKIEQLLKQISKCNSHIFAMAHIPPSLVSIASSTLTGMYFIAQKIQNIGSAILSGIKLAGSIAGAAGGSIAVLLGGLESIFGIRAAVQAYKEKKAVDQKRKAFEEQVHSEKGVPEPIWEIVRKARTLQLGRESLKANKNFQLSVLRTCGGALATVGGALGIASIFTAGIAATGIAIAALVTGMIGAGASIAAYVHKKRLKSEMAMIKISNSQFDQLIAYLKSPQCTEEHKIEIAKLLGLDPSKLLAPDVNLSHEFRKLLCTESDTKEIARYLCTGASTEDEKVKFAQIFDHPVSVIYDRQLFLERILRERFKELHKEIPSSEMRDLSAYFRSEKPTPELKEKISDILKIPVKQLKEPQSVLQKILMETLISTQKWSQEDLTVSLAIHPQTI